jgi:hypothetical protein
MKRRSRPRSGRRTLAAGPAKTNPEVVAFVAAVLRQMDHAAKLVTAFFHRIGMLGPEETSIPGLPGQFLLELAALLQLREWQAAGVIEWSDPEGLTLDDLIALAIERLKQDPGAVAANHRGSEAMIDVVRLWTETCAPDARGYLDADVAIRWDSSRNLNAMVDAFATFLCRHRNAGPTTEAH